MNRLETYFGETGVHDEESALKPFGGIYRFDSRTWSIVVWANDWDAAHEYARIHGLKIDGQIIETFED